MRNPNRNKKTLFQDFKKSRRIFYKSRIKYEEKILARNIFQIFLLLKIIPSNVSIIKKNWIFFFKEKLRKFWFFQNLLCTV